MTVVTFDAQGLGDRSYLISDGTVGVVVDAQRDPAPYIAQATKLEVSIAAVLETHIHNDYVSGGLALSRATGAIYAIPAGEAVSFAGEARCARGRRVLSAGSLEVTAIATDGHTDHHLAYLLSGPRALKAASRSFARAARCCSMPPGARTFSAPRWLKVSLTPSGTR